MNNLEVLRVWTQAPIFLSLDVTSYLTSELGVDAFYSAKLRQLARESIVDIIEEGDFYGSGILYLRDRVPGPFLNVVAARLGSDVADGIREWVTFSCFDMEEGKVLFQWKHLFPQLVKSWDVKTPEASPFIQPEYTELRLRVRDWESHYRSVTHEICILAGIGIGLSDWDKKVLECMENENYIDDELSVFYRDRITKLFVTELSEKLPVEQFQLLSTLANASQFGIS